MRISDWSSDVCSSDLRRGPRAATGASDGPVEATVSGSHGGRRAERAEENGKSRPHGKPVLMGAAGAISPPHPRPWRRERKVDETNQVATAATAGWEIALPAKTPPPSETKAASANRRRIATADRRRNDNATIHGTSSHTAAAGSTKEEHK